MSFLPWLANFLHTFLWIGVCLVGRRVPGLVVL